MLRREVQFGKMSGYTQKIKNTVLQTDLDTDKFNTIMSSNKIQIQGKVVSGVLKKKITYRYLNSRNKKLLLIFPACIVNYLVTPNQSDSVISKIHGTFMTEMRRIIPQLQ